MGSIHSEARLPRAIADALARGATVITANQRAARTLSRAFDRRNREAQVESWRPPSILAWDSWAANLWHTLLLQGHASQLLLNRSQEHVVWRRVIADDPERREVLRSLDSLAELAARAWRLICQYQGIAQLGRYSTNLETRSFHRWANEFQHRCRSERWISPALLEDALAQAIKSGNLKASEEILLVGFDDLSPARQNLIEVLRISGSVIGLLEPELPPAGPMLVEAGSEEEEIQAAARWARRWLQERPMLQVAIVVPSLESKRALIARNFRRILAPELEDIAAPNHAEPYEFSVGSKLADMPFIRVALDLLRWASAPLSIDRVSGLLVSPLFAAGNGEGQARAVFDAVELRKAKLLRPEATLRWMIETVSRVQRMQLSSMLDVLRALERAANRYGLSNSIRPYGEWAEVIHDLLREAKWGRESSEDSVEFQTRKRWEATLDELVTLDFGGTRVGYTDALESLERLARTTTFAPESRDAPVQILGPLEAAGSRFDAIWFLGASDLAWPVSPAANPLLPWALQVELGMPGTEVQADDARDRRLAQRIAASGDVVVVFSYSTEMVAVKQRPAPAVLALQPVVEPLEVISPPDALEPVQTLELFADTISLPPTPDKEMQGGADIFRLQAACAFRAFAEKRVWSTDLRAVELGLDSGERGNVVHRSMEHFWNKVQTQAELKRLSASQRMEALDEAIEHGLHRVAAISSGDWGNAYIEVQRRRLRNILSSWLELELLRDPFEVKLSEKELRDAQIGPLRLRIRVDRIDATEAGDVIIDYKTGRAKTVEWQGERPDAPQLPLYAVLSDALRDRTDLADVAFASIRAGRDMVLDGFVSKITSAGKRDSRNRISLSEQLDQWGQVLVNLATQFHEGDVRVDPKKYPGTCKYCAQRTLCRINPAATEIDEDFDLDDEAANDIGNG